MQAKDNLRHEVIEQLAQGDTLIRMPISPSCIVNAGKSS